MNAPVDDIDRIMVVMEAAFDPVFGEAWSRRQVEDALVFGRCHYDLIGAHGQPPAPGECAAGFYLSRTGFDEEELLLFAVEPRFRHAGLGRKLLNAFGYSASERGALRLLLEMRRGNPAEHLYRTYGFVPIGERPNYYRSAEGRRIDAITFACPALRE